MPLASLIRDVGRWWGRLLLAMLLSYAALGALIWQWPRSFVAQTVVAPAETTGMATSSLLATVPLMQAALLDSRPGGNFGVYLGALRTMEAARLLAAETPILAQMTARRGAGVMGWLRRTLDLRMEADADDVQGFLERSLSPTQDGGSVTWTIELPWYDRALALEMLRRLHAFGEAKVRADLGGMAQRRIGMLQAAIRAERDAFARNAMYDLLAQHQRAAMVVAADEAVAARLVSAPMVELRASVPNRTLLLALLVVAVPMFCVMLAACLVLLRAPAVADGPAPWPSGLPGPWPAPLPPGLPARRSSGLPPGLPVPVPSGLPPRLPARMSSGLPPGLHSGLHSGLPSGLPSGRPPGLPPGLPPGAPAA